VDTLPLFRYHPDPLASGSIVASSAVCRCCDTSRGAVYVGPVYADVEPDDLLEDALCPWCIADGRAHARYDATFVDSEAFYEEVSDAVRAEICERTPGFNAWQSERWPSCCDEPAAFVGPAGIAQVRQQFPRLEGALMSHIVYECGISGGAATRLLEQLDRDRSPTAFTFRCLHCEGMPVYVDHA
jgi:uncharacterized protein CbrC (UPF0167 family)